MQKAFDLKALGDKLKQEGLPLAEQAAEKVVAAVIPWTRESLTLLGGLYAVIGVPALAVLEPLIKGEVDKIDGQPG